MTKAPRKRSTGMPAAEREKFRLLALAFIATLPRTRHASGYDHDIATPLGPLGVTLYTDSDILFVAGRFAYPGVAASVLGAGAVNQYSGKWNFYYGWGCKARDSFIDWKSRIDRVLRVTWVLPVD